jgi:predicted CXXCH cytochrome family protein
MALIVTLALPGVAMAQGIRFTDHDLSFSGGKNVNPANNQICIYCHTPHKAQSTNLLWNHTATLATSWNWGVDLDGAALSATFTGTPLPATLKSGSKRCLGCHDGSVAIGDVSNASNGVGAIIPGLANLSFSDAAGHLNDPGKQLSTVTGTVGTMGGNHPISIPYAGQLGYNGISSSVPATWMGGAIGGYYDIATGVACTSTTGVCTSAPATDGRNGAAINLIPNVVGATTNVGVECSTCHEPHNKYAPFSFFTRVDFANASGLCRSCHNK